MANEIGRRNFLKESAGVVAGVALSSGSAPNLMAKAAANDTVRPRRVGGACGALSSLNERRSERRSEHTHAASQPKAASTRRH